MVVRTFNLGGPGSVNTFYSGPDTGANGITGTPPVGNLQALPLSALSYSTGYTAANGYQNAAILNNAISVAATATGTIDGLGTDFNYAIPSLTLGAASTLVVANGTGTAGSMGNGVFVVTGTTNVTAGSGTLNQTTGTLVLAGGVTDAGAGLTKTGAGNLILGGSAGTFTGPFNINGGFVQLADGASLTTGTTNIGVPTTTSATLDLNGQTATTSGVIVINGGAGPAGKSSATGAGLYNSSATTAVLPAGVSVLVGAATSAGNASIGGFGDIIINGSVQDSVPGSALNKVGPDTLTLNGGNLFTGALNITAGKVVIGNTDALGSNTGGVALSAGAALDLNGFAIGAEPLTLNGAGNTTVGAANTLGNLINSAAGPASFGGTINLGISSSIGGPSLTAGVNGSITLSGAITGSFVQITKVGANNLTLTAGAGVETFIDVQGGSLTFSGAGTQSSTNSANFLRPGATMTLDNTGTAVSSRMGGRGLWLSGNLVINGNAGTAVSEAINQGGNSIAVSTVFANGFGGGTITLNSAGTAGVTLQVASTLTSIFSRAPGGTLFLRGDSLGQIASGAANSSNILGSVTSLGQGGNNGQSAGQTGVWNAPNALIYPWAVADSSATGVGTGFAGYNSFSNVNFGTANTFGVAPISNNTGNGVATPSSSPNARPMRRVPRSMPM